MTDDDVLLIGTEDRVRTLTLNRPQARNALSSTLRTQFFGALRDAEADDAVDVVIITGADPVFCAGLDLKELGDSSQLPDISPTRTPASGCCPPGVCRCACRRRSASAWLAG
jgi:enoyl-CoA hydratase